jgi:hypothetical protein
MTWRAAAQRLLAALAVCPPSASTVTATATAAVPAAPLQTSHASAHTIVSGTQSV